MRGFDCVPPDDAHKETMHLEAEDDEALLGKAKEHVAQYHASMGLSEDQLRVADEGVMLSKFGDASMGLSEDQLRGIISQGAYDVQPARA